MFGPLQFLWWKNANTVTLSWKEKRKSFFSLSLLLLSSSLSLPLHLHLPSIIIIIIIIVPQKYTEKEAVEGKENRSKRITRKTATVPSIAP